MFDIEWLFDYILLIIGILYYINNSITMWFDQNLYFVSLLGLLAKIKV